MKVSGFAFYCEWIKTNCVKKRRELKDDWVMDMKIRFLFNDAVGSSKITIFAFLYTALAIFIS